MKEIYRENRKIIILVLIIVLVAVWSGWGFMFPKEKVKEIYSSSEDFVKKNTNERVTVQTISQYDDLIIMICTNDGKTEPPVLLKKKGEGMWEVLEQDCDYTVEFHFIMLDNSGQVLVWFYSFSQSEETLILIETTSSISYESPIVSVSDSLQTKFQIHEEIYSIDKFVIKTTYYSTRIIRFKKEEYNLMINQTEYPYIKWEEMFKEWKKKNAR